MKRAVMLGLGFVFALSGLVDVGAEGIPAAQLFRTPGSAVTVAPDGSLICEAEEFQVKKPASAEAVGWQSKRWGDNYYAATFANTFLSRKAFLGAPENCGETAASIQVQVPAAGRYLVLVRYEAAYRFETQFKVKVEQGGKTKLDRLYGARDNVKIWAFGEKLKKEVGWSWGAVENVVWEGHDAYAELQPGLATITLIAGKQPGPAAKRNVDLVMLTTDEAQVQNRIAKENYLPLDGLMTQSGDVWIKVKNPGAAKVTITPSWTEHSPYWVHMRTWKPISVAVEPGQTTDWVEIGSVMDSLNDGQWVLNAAGGACKVTFGVKNAAGQIETIRELDVNGKLPLVGFADMRYERRIQTQAEGVKELLDYLAKIPVHGKVPVRTLTYCFTGIPEFQSLYGLASPNSYVDWRKGAADIEVQCKALSEPQRKNIEVVSLGDEITLPTPSGTEATEGFIAYLKGQGVTPKQINPAAGDWTAVTYSVAPAAKASNPGQYYWSMRYYNHFGIQKIKQQTDLVRQYLPNAAVGANYSPHNGTTEHSYLGEVFKWVTCFREDGLTLPWTEDYIWQVPVGSPQMNNISLDLFRAGLRGKPDRKILFYVMPHWPGNTPNMWRRLHYGALGHGMKIMDLFEFQPVWMAYTENHVTRPEMYGMVLKSFRELGLFEDIIQDGQVRGAEAGIWFSETGDIWGDNQGSFAAAKRSLYVAIRNSQIPLDVVVDPDTVSGVLNQYKVLYLTDNHVTQAASKKIAEWVKNGGKLWVTAGGGLLDEYHQPNKDLRDLLGVDPVALDAPADSVVGFIKQDLPFAKAITEVTWSAGADAVPVKFPVFGVVSRVKTAKDVVVQGKFKDDSPAVTVRKVGKGEAIYCAFLPGLSFFRPAIPFKPVDRGSSDDAMAHFLPTEFDAGVRALVQAPAAALKLPVWTDRNFVEAMMVEAKSGIAISVVNWSDQSVTGLNLTVSVPVPKKVELASGGKVEMKKEGDATVFTFDLSQADALILR
jgi:hypothetical protein